LKQVPVKEQAFILKFLYNLIMPIKIIIADDHAMFRKGVRSFLEKEIGIEIVGECGDGFETLKLIEEKKPDVVILDISMPGLPANKVVEEITKKFPKLAIVILTMHEDEYYLKEFLKLGVKAFVLKKSTATELINAIRKANSGGSYIDPSLSDILIPSYIGTSPKKIKASIPLSKRELEILKLLALGYTNEEVSKMLFISKRTVEAHRSNIMNKLQLKNRAELVRFAIDNDIIKF